MDRSSSRYRSQAFGYCDGKGGTYFCTSYSFHPAVSIILLASCVMFAISNTGIHFGYILSLKCVNEPWKLYGLSQWLSGVEWVERGRVGRVGKSIASSSLIVPIPRN